MKSLILIFALSIGVFAEEERQPAKVIDFDGQAFVTIVKRGDRLKKELKLDSVNDPSEIKSYVRREIQLEDADFSKIIDDKKTLQLKASADPFGDSVYLKLKNKHRAKLAKEVINGGQVNIIMDQVRVGVFPEEKQVFVHDKLSGKVVELTPFLDELNRQRELEEGDYHGIGGHMRSLFDRIKGVGTYAEEDAPSQIDDSGREIAKEIDDVPSDEQEQTGQSAQAD